MTTLPDLMTTGQIATRCGLPQWRVARFIRSRGISPLGRIGILRVFAPEVAELVGRGLLPKPVQA